MNILKNERGIALVMVLVLSLIALAITAGLIYMVTQGTRFSGMQKRYKTALEANIGGVEAIEHIIVLRGESPGVPSFITDLTNSGLNPVVQTPDPGCTGTDTFGTPFTGIEAKIRTPTNNFDGLPNWSALCNSSLSIDAVDPITDPANTTYDFYFQLGSAPDPVYDVYAKIANTVEGNAAKDLKLKKCGVVACGGNLVPHLGYLYTIEVVAQANANPRERAKTSVLFEY